MQTVIVEYKGAKIELGVETVVKNFLASVDSKPEKQMIFNIPKIGQQWPEQGGIYVGLIRGEAEQQDRHLILPTDDCANFKDVKWGKTGKEIDGANHVYDGMANTKAMAKSGSKLAKDILALKIDGHSDFYLPSRHEARLCYLNASDFFETDDYYWTSTQYSARYAFVQYFYDGSQYLYGKDFQYRARAVRSFVSNLVI